MSADDPERSRVELASEDGMKEREREIAELKANSSWRWPGVIGAGKWLLHGSPEPTPTLVAARPRVAIGEVDTSKTTSEIYSSMDQDYKWFRKDRLVRRCILTNAYFSTLSSGFETELQVTDQSLPESAQEAILERFKDVKVFIDDLNKKLNMDQVLFVTQIKRSIYGKAAWEIVMDGGDQEEGTYPDWLLSLNSKKVTAKQDKKTWELLGFRYGNKRQNPPKYKPEDIFLITNTQLENDYEGLSDIEPIRPFCDARNEVIWENWPEIVRTLWAPVNIASVDTSGMSDQAETTFLNTLGKQLRAGKALAVNKSIEITSIALKADIAGLALIFKDLKEEIIGNFQTPRFMLGQPIENRATAYAEFEAYVEGPIAGIQQDLTRVMEAWYDRWIRVYLREDANNKMNTPEDGKPIVEVKHIWNIARVTDIYAAAEAAAKLWGASGMGPLGIRQDYAKIGELMGWVNWPPKEELEEAPEEIPEETPEDAEKRRREEEDRQGEAIASGVAFILKETVKKLDDKIESALEAL